MTKQSGLGDALLIHGVDVSGDIQALGQVRGGMATQDTTGINKFAHERIGLVRDGNIDMATFFNPTRLHPEVSALPYTDVIVTYCRGTTIGKPAACQVSKQINYDPNRGDGGELHFAVQAQANGFGLEWGEQHTATPRTDTAATNGAGVDGGAASSFGLQAYLHVVSFVGTDATIKLQQSSDNGSGDAYADVTGGGFTQVTAAPVAQRIATAGDQAVERWLRVVTTTSGGFSSLVFTVVVARNLTATVF